MYRHVNTNDPRTWSVTHNGRPVYDVVMADTDRGVVELFCHDKNGCRIPNAENPTGYDTLELKGEVEITDHPLPEKQPAQQSMEEMFGYQGFGLCFTEHPLKGAHPLMEAFNEILRQKAIEQTQISRLDYLRYSRLCPVSGGGEGGECDICREYEQLTGMFQGHMHEGWKDFSARKQNERD